MVKEGELELRCPSSPTLNIGTPGSQAFGLRLGLTSSPVLPIPRAPFLDLKIGTYTIMCHGSLALKFRLNYATGFPGSLAFRQQIMGLLGLCNCVNQLI